MNINTLEEDEAKGIVEETEVGRREYKNFRSELKAQ